MLYTPVKVVVAKDQLERLKYQLNKPSLSIRIRLKGIKKGVDDETHYFSIGKRTFRTIRLSKNQIERNKERC